VRTGFISINKQACDQVFTTMSHAEFYYLKTSFTRGILDTVYSANLYKDVNSLT
jgi:hypothetical protein